MILIDMESTSSLKLDSSISKRVIKSIKQSPVLKKDVIGISTASYNVIASGVYVSCQVENGAG